MERDVVPAKRKQVTVQLNERVVAGTLVPSQLAPLERREVVWRGQALTRLFGRQARKLFDELATPALDGLGELRVVVREIQER